MPCGTKTALLIAYEKASREYSDAVSDLARAVGAALYSEYEMVMRKVVVAREASQQARARLKEHLDEHMC